MQSFSWFAARDREDPCGIATDRAGDGIDATQGWDKQPAGWLAGARSFHPAIEKTDICVTPLAKPSVRPDSGLESAAQ